MMSMLATSSAIAKTIAILALLSIGIGLLERRVAEGFMRASLTALAFAATAVVAMSSPVVLAPGLIIDGRAAIVGLGAAFGGPLTAIVAPLASGGFRYFAVGGMGALPGTAGIVCAAILGFVWGHFFVNAKTPGPLQRCNYSGRPASARAEAYCSGAATFQRGKRGCHDRRCEPAIPFSACQKIVRGNRSSDLRHRGVRPRPLQVD